jgi:hypothetical protein
MILNLYRRHGARCDGKRTLHAMSYEHDEMRRSWKNCCCPIYASGTLARQFKRKNTERTDWEDARALARAWEDAGSWDGPAPKTEPVIRIPEPAGPATDTGRITIDRAIDVFTAEYRENAAPATLKKYGLLFKKLKAFSANRGYVVIDQWTPIDVREFRASWSVKPQTAAKSMSTVKAFFEFCLSNEWIQRNPARLVKNPRGRDAADRRNEQKLPFSDAELTAMYEACKTKYGKAKYPGHEYKWTGEDVADFISVSVYRACASPTSARSTLTACCQQGRFT